MLVYLTPVIDGLVTIFSFGRGQPYARLSGHASTHCFGQAAGALLLVADESRPSAWELDCHASVTTPPQVSRRPRALRRFYRGSNG